MSHVLSDLDRKVLRLLDDYPEGLPREQIIQLLEGTVTAWDLQELVVKGFLEKREGRLRAIGNSPPLKG